MDQIGTLLQEIPGMSKYWPYLSLAFLVNTLLIVPCLPIPTDKSNAVYSFFYRVLNKCAGNYLNAQNQNKSADKV